MPDEKVFLVRPDDIVHDTIDGETVVIDLRNGIYFRFDGAAAHAWNVLLGGATEDELVDQVGASYTAPRETIAAQVHAFLATLYRDGIILREDPRAAVLGAAAARAGLGAAQASHETGLGAVGSSRETGLGTTGASDESMLGTAAAARETPVAPVVSQPGVSEQFTGLPLERFGNLRPLVGGPVDDRLPFDSMTVNRFEDLDQLLSIDPVHEVKDAGWPHRQAAD